ncbi:retrotransposon protein [Tanacetum coccineum]
MVRNRRLFTSYKEYDGGHVIFGSNLKGKVVGGGQLCDDDCLVSFTKKDCAVSKNNKTLAKGHRRNGLYTSELGDNSEQEICLATVVDNSTLWHRRLGHANMRLVQNLASNELVKNLPKLSFERHFCDTCVIGSQGKANNRAKKEVSTNKVLELLNLDLVGLFSIQSYGVLNKETMRIEESLNVTFDESLPEPKLSSSVEDDRIDEPIVQDLNGSPSLQVNVSDEGYPKSLKEARGHPIEQVIGESNERTLRNEKYTGGMALSGEPLAIPTCTRGLVVHASRVIARCIWQSYHPGKANVVADALSRKEKVKPKRLRAMNMTLQSSIKDKILATQKEVVGESTGLHKGLDEMIEQRSDETLYYLDRI